LQKMKKNSRRCDPNVRNRTFRTTPVRAFDSDKKGQKAVKETAIHCDSGWVSCYICLPCIETWLEEIGEELEPFEATQDVAILA